MASPRVADPALTISVRPAGKSPTWRSTVAPRDGRAEATPGLEARIAEGKAGALAMDVRVKRDGAPEQVTEPFKNPRNYVKAVESAEALLKDLRGKLTDAQGRKANAENLASGKLAEVTGARDARNAGALKPLTAAKEAQEARRKELQAPIDQTWAKLAEARAELEVATFPNKRDLDAARAKAHNDAHNKANALNSAQGRLDQIVNQIASDRNELASNRNGLAQARTEAIVIGTNLGHARSDYERARYNAPSEYDVNRSYNILRDAQSEYDGAQRDVENARDRVDSRRRDLDRALANDRPEPPSGNDRPTPPSDSDRPTPPSGNDRPRPPSGSDRPTPPSSSDRPKPPGTGSDRPVPPSAGSSDRPKPPSIRDGDPDEVARARAALSEAERDLNSAERRRNGAGDELESARGRYDQLKTRWDLMIRRGENVQALQASLIPIQNNMNQYDSNIRTL